MPGLNPVTLAIPSLLAAADAHVGTDPIAIGSISGSYEDPSTQTAPT